MHSGDISLLIILPKQMHRQQTSELDNVCVLFSDTNILKDVRECAAPSINFIHPPSFVKIVHFIPKLFFWFFWHVHNNDDKCKKY